MKPYSQCNNEIPGSQVFLFCIIIYCKKNSRKNSRKNLSKIFDRKLTGDISAPIGKYFLFFLEVKEFTYRGSNFCIRRSKRLLGRTGPHPTPSKLL